MEKFHSPELTLEEELTLKVNQVLADEVWEPMDDDDWTEIRQVQIPLGDKGTLHISQWRVTDYHTDSYTNPRNLVQLLAPGRAGIPANSFVEWTTKGNELSSGLHRQLINTCALLDEALRQNDV